MNIYRGQGHVMSDRTCRFFLIAIALLFILALCQPASAAARDVKIAVPELRPMVFTDEQGNPAGMFVDILEDIAVKEGWNIIWVRGSLSESWDRLASGDIDLIMGVADTPERQKLYDFSHEPALSAWSQVYAPGGSGINTILDLDGKRVALLKGDVNGIEFRNYAKKFDINVTYIEMDSLDGVFSATAAGKADAVVTFSLAGEQSANKYGLSETTVMFNPSSLFFAVPEGKNQDLLTAIDRYLAEGKGNPSSAYSQTMQKWFGMKGESGVIPSYIWWGLGVIAGLAVLFVTMSFLLRREVKKKTAELSRQNAALQSEVARRTRVEKELVRKNEELYAAYEQLTATEEELRENYQELSRKEQALRQARKKLNLLNMLTGQEIQNGLFSLSGYIELAKEGGCDETARTYLAKGGEILRSVDNTLRFVKNYQDMGSNPPKWHDINYVVITALSHMDFSHISRIMDLDNLEIYADPMLEKVFVNILENVIRHGAGADRVTLQYRQNPDGITILIEDNGPGIPAADKEKIFERGYAEKTGSGLFLAREILSITGISLKETGEPGKGARFEIFVPEGDYRFPENGNDPT
ncbi:MAG: sensory histidine kinase AtoS [Methanoregula sp. PtaU1.Bin051]|nr:MAG: sensory histidine kinase AtoS [Methanoregula sp. PtaU1.Bin051]